MILLLKGNAIDYEFMMINNDAAKKMEMPKKKDPTILYFLIVISVMFALLIGAAVFLAISKKILEKTGSVFLLLTIIAVFQLIFISLLAINYSSNKSEFIPSEACFFSAIATIIIYILIEACLSPKDKENNNLLFNIITICLRIIILPFIFSLTVLCAYLYYIQKVAIIPVEASTSQQTQNPQQISLKSSQSYDNVSYITDKCTRDVKYIKETSLPTELGPLSAFVSPENGDIAQHINTNVKLESPMISMEGFSAVDYYNKPNSMNRLIPGENGIHVILNDFDFSFNPLTDTFKPNSIFNKNSSFTANNRTVLNANNYVFNEFKINESPGKILVVKKDVNNCELDIVVVCMQDLLLICYPDGTVNCINSNKDQNGLYIRSNIDDKINSCSLEYYKLGTIYKHDANTNKNYYLDVGKTMNRKIGTAGIQINNTDRINFVKTNDSYGLKILSTNSRTPLIGINYNSKSGLLKSIEMGASLDKGTQSNQNTQETLKFEESV